MKTATILPLIVVALSGAATATPRAGRPQQWSTDVAEIASDKNEGRMPGSSGYLRAADYVIARFRQLRLSPAGDKGGYKQEIAFEQQSIDHKASTAKLVAPDGTTTPLTPGETALISAGGARRPAEIEAPLVFIGYGLHLPKFGHDDFAGVDLKGKIAVVVSGGPPNIPGPVKAANRSARTRFLAEAGAVGLISLVTPKQVEIPWARTKSLASQPGMYLADAVLRETPDNFMAASIDPAQSALLFAGTGHDFAEIATAADASQPVPGFALAMRLKASVVATWQPVISPNLVALLPGSDRKLKGEYVVLSAHLDHLGVGTAIKGDAIYNGAMDDASGVASVLDIANRMRGGPRPKRSILFLIVTAEEKGLLGSHYYARRPTVQKAAIVADLNLDMPLPLWPLRTVLVQGENESSLGQVARAAAADEGLALTPDPLPDRNSFVRTDQFSFVKAGIPALAFKFGFEKGTPEFQIEHDWRANHYHAPSDDANQPGVLNDQAVRLDDYVAAVALLVANGAARPEWLEGSVFNIVPSNTQSRSCSDPVASGRVVLPCSR